MKYILIAAVFLSNNVNSFTLPSQSGRFVVPHFGRARTERTGFTSTTVLQSSLTETKPTISNAATDVGLSHQAITLFGKGCAGAGAEMKHILGGKGANLAEMSSIGLSVPPGFTISTECCSKFCSDWNQKIPDSIWDEVKNSIDSIEQGMGSSFGSETNPLLLSVRSG